MQDVGKGDVLRSTCMNWAWRMCLMLLRLWSEERLG